MPAPKTGIRNSDAGLTMEDLAKLAGVSKITVSRALRDSPLVTPETREKVRQIASEQGYRLNVSARNLRMRRSYSVAVVVWGAPEPGGDYIVVGSDNRAGGVSAAQRFIDQGRRKLVFLGDVDHAEVQERCAGFIDAMGGQGTVHIMRPKAFTFEAGFDCISALLKKKGPVFDGVFAASDSLAMGAIRALAEKNMRVPESVSVIGYDDTPSAASFVPPLTSGTNYTVSKLALTGAAIADVTTTYGTAANTGAVTFTNVIASDVVTPGTATLVTP
eukprot:gene31422-35470_t